MENEDIIKDALIFAKTLNKDYEAPNHQAMIEAILRKALSNKKDHPLAFMGENPFKDFVSQVEGIFKK